MNTDFFNTVVERIAEYLRKDRLLQLESKTAKIRGNDRLSECIFREHLQMQKKIEQMIVECDAFKESFLKMHKAPYGVD